MYVCLRVCVCACNSLLRLLVMLECSSVRRCFWLIFCKPPCALALTPSFFFFRLLRFLLRSPFYAPLPLFSSQMCGGVLLSRASCCPNSFFSEFPHVLADLVCSPWTASSLFFAARVALRPLLRFPRMVVLAVVCLSPSFFLYFCVSVCHGKRQHSGARQ